MRSGKLFGFILNLNGVTMRRKSGINVAIAAAVSVIVMGAFVPHPSFAQSTPSGKLSTRTTSPVYESAFEGYHPFQDSEMKSWRTANEEIAKTDYMGGMAGMEQEKGGASGSARPKSSPATAGSREKGSDNAKSANPEGNQTMGKMDKMSPSVNPAKESAKSQSAQPTQPGSAK